MDVDIELFGVATLHELPDDNNELGGSKVEKLSKSVSALFLASAFAAIPSTEEVDDGDSPCVESCQGDCRGLDWRSNGGSVETKDDVVDGTEGERRDSLNEAGGRVKRGTERHQLKL